MPLSVDAKKISVDIELATGSVQKLDRTPEASRYPIHFCLIPPTGFEYVADSLLLFSTD